MMRDYKTQFLQDEYEREFNSVESWIYIGIDMLKAGIFKVGLTTGKLGTRATSSQNPDYVLVFGFKIKVGVSPDKVSEIEKAVLLELGKIYEQRCHVSTGRKSEWFVGNYLEAKEFVNDFLYYNYSWEMMCYYCGERRRGIVYGWQSERILNGGESSTYRVTDISNPPENPDCYIYGGCGDPDCENCSDNWFLKNRHF